MSSTKNAHSSILNVALFQLQVRLHRLMVPSDSFASDIFWLPYTHASGLRQDLITANADSVN